jgi:hypothetical protein
MRWVFLGIFVVLAVLALFWLFEIWRANRIAQRDFGPTPCWFVQKASADDPPSLVAGPRGFYVPNPLRQLNRRFLRLGGDPGVAALHFAVAARDGEGVPNLWAWSYRERRFWELPKAGTQSDNGFYNAGYAEEILAACTDLPQAPQ